MDGRIFLIALWALVMPINGVSLANQGAAKKKNGDEEVEVSRRSIPQFGKLISCFQADLDATKAALAYTEYGCWCGLGGSGIPVDGTDQCCYDHDMCYNNANHECKPDELKYVVDYDYDLYSCGTDSASITCAPVRKYSSWWQRPWRDCAFAVCECDRIAAECFARERDAGNYDSSKLYKC